MSKLKIYMGSDDRETLAYEVAKFSILSRTESDVEVIPIERKTVTHIIDRPTELRDNKQLWDVISDAPMSTEFAIARFCVPLLEGRGEDKGWALFIDPDIVCLTDIKELFDQADPNFAVMVVKHNHIPTEETKFHDAGMIQTKYPRKNWSSVILWNLDHPGTKKLGKWQLNRWPGRDLHAFKWLQDNEIGELKQEWNFLVGVNEGKLEDQKILHYTDGTPAWSGWKPLPTDYVWNNELKLLQACSPQV